MYKILPYILYIVRCIVVLSNSPASSALQWDRVRIIVALLLMKLIHYTLSIHFILGNITMTFIVAIT